ncbi:peptidoglycan endopeptidase [Stutzerimonas nosocomialis]|uniref:C40 family peptidase n=1 Tax=Stutzerimonas nosocomialis TaxID=1056496 RepID=UPI0011091A7C|nr:NlpC/P60 family protein [Stutzerimonas nosocomialis]TLX59585.1 peptidoglycan endopeptidase [Stutzerimonas nosocomialis]
MLKRFAPLVPFALIALLGACATAPQTPDSGATAQPIRAAVGPAKLKLSELPEAPAEVQVGDFDEDHDYRLPQLADSVLERGFGLVGTPYRYGGRSVKTGFDCSGFVGFVFRKETGIELPRSTGEMIKLDAPRIRRDQLVPGDIVFFNNRGRGRVSHAGIYIGDDQFIHSASRRSGGVRVDSLDDAYWRASFMEAKRILASAPSGQVIARHP